MTKFSIVTSVGKHQGKHSVDIYQGNYSEKKNKKFRKVNEINLMVKFVHKYTDRNIPSVYTNKITNNITMKFKKGKSYGDVTLFTERMTKGMSD